MTDDELAAAIADLDGRLRVLRREWHLRVRRANMAKAQAALLDPVVAARVTAERSARMKLLWAAYENKLQKPKRPRRKGNAPEIPNLHALLLR